MSRTPTRSPASRAGGTWSSAPACRSTPTATSSSAPTCSAAAWAPPAHAARATTATDAPWGTDFPPITIRDMVRAQKRLIDHLGINRLFAVIGGSMGGMQVLEWAAAYPDAVFAAIPIAAAAYHSAQNIAFNEVGRQAIFADPDWQRRPLLGNRQGARPRPGRSPYGRAHHLPQRTGADPQVRPPPARGPNGATGLSACSATCSRWKATCATRAAASSAASTPTRYLTITRAMDYFDLAAEQAATSPAPSPAPAPGSAWSQLHSRLAVPDRRKPRHRPRAEPRLPPT